jgi:hypothetical protein
VVATLEVLGRGLDYPFDLGNEIADLVLEGQVEMAGILATEAFGLQVPTKGRPMGQHVFVSYSRLDQIVVDRIVSTLRSSGIKVWLDRDSIKPGQRWKRAIKEAIRDGAAFIACFSEASVSRSGSAYMNEELTQAVDELRARPRDTAWFIPLRIDNCDIPDISLGAGECLADLQRIDVFPDEAERLRQLVETLRSLS